MWAFIDLIALALAYFDWLSIGTILSSQYVNIDAKLKFSILIFCYIIIVVVVIAVIPIIWDLFVYFVLQKGKDEPKLDMIPSRWHS